jgi:hypothetical protein
MSISRRSTAEIALCLAAVGVSVVAGCGQPAENKPTGSSAVQPAYDISHIDRVKDDLPPGFAAEAEPAKTLSQQDIANSGITAFTEAQVNPPQCRAVLIPPNVEPSVGTQAAGVRGQGEQGNIYLVALRLPQPARASQLPAGCDRVSVSGSAKASGTAERIAAPNIPGISTTGAKLSVNAAEDPDYVFTAALDDQTSVVVMGSTDAQLNPQGLLSDLLVKATSAVRGQ